MGDNTEIIIQPKVEIKENVLVRPTLFVCEGHHIAEYRMQGLQNLGRPSEKSMPEIPVYSKFVSRNHGIFETDGTETVFTAINTTNGIMFQGEFLKPWEKLKLKDGYELTVPSGDEETSSVLIIYACSDERIQFWRRIQEASWDKLTGLCDRDSFITWWKQNSEKKDYENVSLFIMDVDDFKYINDKEGHNAGDEALKIIAEKLRRSVRYENQVCRWGGDEFVGIIPDKASGARERLLELSANIRAASADAGIPLSVSVGYVDMRTIDNIFDIPKLVGMADKALYETKSVKKGCINEYKPDKI